MVIVQQLRSARSALKWSIDDLSIKSNVSVRTIKKIEYENDKPQCKPSTLKKIVRALESADIKFIGTPDDGPGIRIHPQMPD